MNLQQLNYIVAVDEHRHFQKAAEASHITPATLSMMIKKLEDELNVILFDRSKQPVIPTEIGKILIEKARKILHHVKDFEQTAKVSGQILKGEVRIGIIPTLSPYLSPLFLPSLIDKYPNLRVKIHEWNTSQIVDGLIHGRIDVGIAATPIHQAEIKEKPLFYEELIAYSFHEPNSGKYIVPEDIDLSKLWLLEEEHCLRSQVTKLCSLKKKFNDDAQLEFEAGSIATLMNMVKINDGITIIPELVLNSLSEDKQKNIRRFAEPVPVREISLLTYRHFLKLNLLNALEEELLTAVKGKISDRTALRKVIEIE